MSATKIRWYSINENLDAQEREFVDLARAIQIADDYLARANQRFEDGEKAIAATMFGFSRSDKEFIEICVHSAAQISYKFEASDNSVHWLLKPWKGTFQFEEELRSRELLVHRIEEFFLCSPGEIIQKFKRRV